MAISKINSKALGAGAVLQVLNYAYSTQISTTSSSFSDVGLAVTITPISASSKILVFVEANGLYTQSSSTTSAISLQLVRNSTVLSIFEAIAGYKGSAIELGVGGSSISYLDSPATTSATTYKLQIASTLAGKTAYVNCYAVSGYTSASTITVMEIAG